MKNNPCIAIATYSASIYLQNIYKNQDHFNIEIPSQN